MDNKTYGFKVLNFRSYHKKALWDNKHFGGEPVRNLVQVEEHEKLSDEVYKAAYIDHNFLEYFSKDNYIFAAAFKKGKRSCQLGDDWRKRDDINKKAMIHYLKAGRFQSEMKHLLGIEKKYNLHMVFEGEGSSGVGIEKRGISMNLKGDELFSKLRVTVGSSYKGVTSNDARRSFGVGLFLNDNLTCEDFYKKLLKEKVLELK